MRAETAVRWGMQLSETLSRRLREMYEEAAKENKLSIVPSLFGILYAEQISNRAIPC